MGAQDTDPCGTLLPPGASGVGGCGFISPQAVAFSGPLCSLLSPANKIHHKARFLTKSSLGKTFWQLLSIKVHIQLATCVCMYTYAQLFLKDFTSIYKGLWAFFFYYLFGQCWFLFVLFSNQAHIPILTIFTFNTG